MEDHLVYDGTFNGLLCCVFTAFEQKLNVRSVVKENSAHPLLFGNSHIIYTKSDQAERVWTGLKLRVNATTLRKIYYAFLSEIEGIETNILLMISEIFRSEVRIETDYSNPAILAVHDTAKKVGREKHRMEAFVRFQKTRDSIYFSIIEPEFHVLPLISKHFKERYADQRWIIYDNSRKLGLFYDFKSPEYIELDLPGQVFSENGKSLYFTEDEADFQKLWKTYFESTNIQSRVNKKLHFQHIPKKYWKFLTEKNPFT